MLAFLVMAMVPLSAWSMEYRDMGNKDDFDPAQNIHFDLSGGFGGCSAPKYWNLKVSGTVPRDMIPPKPPAKPKYWDDTPVSTGGALFENTEHFWWVCPPPANARNVINSRAIKMHQYGRFRVKANQLPANDDLFLSLRAKDDLIGPAPVYVWNGQKKWTRLGDFGGKFDHRWKTVQYSVPADARQLDNGEYVFKIGVDAYKDSLHGELSIDRIGLGATRDRAPFPSDQDGFWPQGPASHFKDLGKTMKLIPSQEPYFMFGVWDASHFITDGGGPDHAGHGAKDAWQQFENAGINTYIFHNWAADWDSFWKLDRGGAVSRWAAPGVRVEPGLDQQIIQAAGHHLKIIPNFLGDTREYWIKNKYRGEQNALDAMGKIMAAHDHDPTILAWYPVDEWDHEDDHFGKPILYSRLLYNQVRESSPNKPSFMLLMGFKGVDGWRIAQRSANADIFGIDCYISDFAKNGGTAGALKAQGERLDEMRKAFGRDVPYVLAPELQHQRQGHLTPAEVVAQGYQAIIHGARGIMYFAYFYKPPEDVWVGPRQMSHELFDPKEGLARLILPASSLLEVNGDARIVRFSNHPAIQSAVFVDARGRCTLVTLNATQDAVSAVKFEVAGLGNATVRTRFESGRTLKARGGAFTDDYAPLERHVYDLGTR
jgi:hypothetical protein